MKLFKLEALWLKFNRILFIFIERIYILMKLEKFLNI